MDDQQLLSGLPLDFFEDDLHMDLFAISPALMEKFANNSENFKLELVPKEHRIIDDEWLEDSKKENCSPMKENVTTKEDTYFGTKFTDEKELEVHSKGSVPKNTDSNTGIHGLFGTSRPGMNGEKRKIQKNECQSVC